MRLNSLFKSDILYDRQEDRGIVDSIYTDNGHTIFSYAGECGISELLDVTRSTGEYRMWGHIIKKII